METPTRKIIIDNPEVATVTVQGQTVYQVGGGTVREEVLELEALMRMQSWLPHKQESALKWPRKH